MISVIAASKLHRLSTHFQYSYHSRIFAVVKSLSFILACYVFCLSVGPIMAKALVAGAGEECATVCCLTEHEECTPVAEADHSPSPDGCCDDGMCNPFAGCPGCAGFTIPAILGLANPPDSFTHQPYFTVTVNPRLADHGIWHPPQII